MIPIRYRQQLPSYWYDNEVARLHLVSTEEEILFQNNKIQELGNQYLLPYATFGLDIWDWIYFGDKRNGTVEERREEIRKKNIAKANFTLDTLYVLGRMAGDLKKVTEDFTNKEIIFEFSGYRSINLMQLAVDFEKIRPVHVLKEKIIASSYGGITFTSGPTKFYETQKRDCGAFFSGGENDLC
ncbi:hypothetical protein C4A75_13175 [Brevibacillus laterosporus]|uniref:hypothetical protein n=1 Tax=Brevibacillus laterosporus TaxID=1465 RepID=UPI000CE56FC9|nr:hypothetical protein [Brevibacillus laterosporus]PPA84036.1 hypothetical protein C4A75_13175 [Brevibacillus laterosporus]